MATFTTRVLFVSCVLPAVVAGAAACSTGPSTVDKSDIQNQISSKMTDASGNKPESVNCPNALNATVGAATDCEMTVKGQPFNVNVTVTSVDGDKVKFDMVETVDKAQVASEISDQLGQQIGHTPESVTCPDNLKGDPGATLRCELTDSGQTYGVNVTVTGVDAGDVKFDIKVDDQPK